VDRHALARCDGGPPLAYDVLKQAIAVSDRAHRPYAAWRSIAPNCVDPRNGCRVLAVAGVVLEAVAHSLAGKTMKFEKFRLNFTASIVATGALMVVGCGSASTKASSSKTVTASSGGTLTAGVATLTIPPGTLARDTTVTLREAEPQHSGRAARVEVEPHDALIAGQALLGVRINDSNVRVKIHRGADDSLADVEVDDRNHNAFKTSFTTLGDVEVEVEHGTACATACAAGQECDDGVCQDHNESAKTCSAVCAMGEECDDGVCKTHDQCALDHNLTPGTCSPSCASGLTCHDGVCTVHG